MIVTLRSTYTTGMAHLKTESFLHDLCNILYDSYTLCPFRLSHTQVINTKYKELFCICSVLYSSALRTDLFHSSKARGFVLLLAWSFRFLQFALEVRGCDGQNKQQAHCVFCEV